MAAHKTSVAVAGNGFQRRGINDFLDGFDFAIHFLRGELELVKLALGERFAAQPEQARLEPVQFVRRICFQRRHRAAFDENLLGQRDADGFAGAGVVLRWRVPALNGLDGAALVAGTEQQPVAHLDGTGLDAAREDAPVIKPINILDGKTQRLIVRPVRHLEFIQRGKHRRPLPPRHVRA